MKKLLNFLGITILITSGSSNLISCNNTILTSEELTKLKSKNSKTINGNTLEWIVPQEKPFNAVDNKWYVIIWRGNKNDGWYLSKFNNNTYDTIIIKGYTDDYSLMYRVNDYFGIHSKKNNFEGKEPYFHYWKNKNYNYFKAVYRWDGINKPLMLKINEDGEITN